MKLSSSCVFSMWWSFLLHFLLSGIVADILRGAFVTNDVSYILNMLFITFHMLVFNNSFLYFLLFNDTFFHLLIFNNSFLNLLIINTFFLLLILCFFQLVNLGTLQDIISSIWRHNNNFCTFLLLFKFRSLDIGSICKLSLQNCGKWLTLSVLLLIDLSLLG